MTVNINGYYQRFILCPKCDKVMVLWSKSRKHRKIGHIKTMNCYFCGELVDGIEVKRPEERRWD